MRVISWTNFRNYIGGFIDFNDVYATSFETYPFDFEEQGFGIMPEKGELSNTEIIHPTTVKYKFTTWKKRCPFMIGVILTRWNLKFYLTFYLFGIGFVPAEILWERKLNQNSQ